MKQIVELGNRECRWPIAEDPDEGHWFCAEHTAAGESYCPTHHALSLPEGVSRRFSPWQDKRDATHSPARRAANQAARESESQIHSRDHEPDLVELFGVGR